MQIVSSAVVDARSEREDGPLNLAILPPFGAAWLAPRLWELASERPRLAINFAARAEPFDFESDTIDAAIYLGKPDWPGAMLDELMRAEIVPACSPQMVAAQRSEEHTSELQSLMRISYAVFRLKNKNKP